MVTRIDESNAPVSAQSIEITEQSSVTSRIDVYRDLAGLLVSGDLAGTPSGEFLKLFRSTATEISLTDLPYELASMILESRAETMKDFFESWSKSLQEQSKLDKEAHQRRELQKGALSPAERHFASCLDAAERTGKVSVEEVHHLKGDIQLLAASAESPTFTSLSLDSQSNAQPSLGALEPPKSTGVTLRMQVGAPESSND